MANIELCPEYIPEDGTTHYGEIIVDPGMDLMPQIPGLEDVGIIYDARDDYHEEFDFMLGVGENKAYVYRLTDLESVKVVFPSEHPRPEYTPGQSNAYTKESVIVRAEQPPTDLDIFVLSAVKTAAKSIADYKQRAIEGENN